MPADVRACCECYVWPREQRDADAAGRTGILHAKCAIADGRTCFLGSANLTTRALERNLELGLLVTSEDVAGTIVRQLRWLVDERVLVLADGR